MRTRRALLRTASVLASVGLVGCLAAEGPGTETRTDTHTPTERTARPTATDRPTYRPSTVSLRLEPASLDGVVEQVVRTREELTERQRDALDKMRETGSYALDGVLRHERLLFPGEPFVRHGEGVARVEETVVAERPVTVHRFHVETLSDSRPDAVAFADLSALDRSVFREALTEEYLQNGTPFAGTFLYAFEDANPADSRFVAEGPVDVAYDGDAFAVEFLRTQRLTETNVRYALSTVADSREAFREHLRSTYVRDLPWQSLSGAERDIVRQAVRGERYREERPLSAAFSAVLETVDDLPSVLNAGTYVRHDGELYRVQRRAVEV